MAKKQVKKVAKKQQKNTKKKRKATPASWKPGQSGNPNGRPPAGWSWAEMLREMGDKTKYGTGKTYKEIMGKKLWEECIRGNVHAMKALMNRMDGLPKQAHEFEGALNVIIDSSLKREL